MHPKRPIIVVDEGIPGIMEALSPFGQIRSVRAEIITRSVVRDAEILIVRSVTRIDERLLDGTSVRFVGTATAGTDHVDRRCLQRRNVRFASAPGANAESVGDYVLAAILRLSAIHGRPLIGRTIGIVGCGQVGGRLARRCSSIGLNVLQNDPPRADRARRRDVANPFVELDELLDASDIVTVHVPLTDRGDYPTRNLISAGFLDRMNPGTWLINTSRGPVLDETAILAVLESGRGPERVVLDVWAGEPYPDRRLVEHADLATAHIAGYAIDSKWRATARIRDAVAKFVGQAAPTAWPLPQPGPRAHRPEVWAVRPEVWLDRLVASVWDIGMDDRRLRRAVLEGGGKAFEDLRTGYPERRLFSRCVVDPVSIPPVFREPVYRGLRFSRPGTVATTPD